MNSAVSPITPEQIVMSAQSSNPVHSSPAEQEIDTRGTRCPLPLLRAKQALKGMQVGQRLKVLATDPAAKADFEAMLSHLPHTLVAVERCKTVSGEYDLFLIEKGAE